MVGCAAIVIERRDNADLGSHLISAGLRMLGE
jgi:hypothetical protein